MKAPFMHARDTTWDVLPDIVGNDMEHVYRTMAGEGCQMVGGGTMGGGRRLKMIWAAGGVGLRAEGVWHTVRE